MPAIKKAKPDNKKDSFSRQDTLDMLTSTVGYMRESGFTVSVGVRDGKLYLRIDDADYEENGEETRFVVPIKNPVLANPDESAGK